MSFSPTPPRHAPEDGSAYIITLLVLVVLSIAGLSVALVTSVNEDNSVDMMLQDGTPSSIEWFGISWARPYIDRDERGPAPETAADVLSPGDIIYVMPITVGGWALAQLPRTLRKSGKSMDDQFKGDFRRFPKF